MQSKIAKNEPQILLTDLQDPCENTLTHKMYISNLNVTDLLQNNQRNA